jgi:hypothetical protein
MLKVSLDYFVYKRRTTAKQQAATAPLDHADFSVQRVNNDKLML